MYIDQNKYNQLLIELIELIDKGGLYQTPSLVFHKLSRNYVFANKTTTIA